MQTENDIKRELIEKHEYLNHLKKNRIDNKNQIKLISIQCVMLCWVLEDFDSMGEFIREYEDEIPF